jgi:hypothetical protein
LDKEADKCINIRKLIGSLCDYTNAPKNVVGKEKVNVYLPSLRMKVPDHLYVFGSLLLQ